ncbi:hypothetical protein RND81_02G201000 [Saponaria officinalis]|uniref:DNL-type domain-containing protein n=1 Tax=Saponaria officinalis TaxID=3572 RepID=A0AAW1MP01_SAPOF
MSSSTATSSVIFTLVNHPTRHHHPRASSLTFIPPNFTPKLNPRLRISRNFAVSSNQGYCVPVQFCCSGSGNAGISSETIDDSSKESSINLKLPRRSLLVQFTCNSCGGSTKRLINRVAYERGTVFVQCSGCLQHHKLVDNLGLVVEYDFQNDTNED